MKFPARLAWWTRRPLLHSLAALKEEINTDRIDTVIATHYHDDHTDHASKVAKRFGAKVLYSNKIQDIVENPARYRMPCLTTNPITGEVKGEADSWQWREFRMASYFFPGQTLYHGGLHIERESSEKIFFVG